MEMFHIIVLAVAVVLLILVLTLVGVMLNNTSANLSYPPAYNTCPDYWTVSTDGSSCIIPTYSSSLNIGGLYNSNTGALNASVQSTPGYNFDSSNNIYSINFTANGWKGLCSQNAWANMNGIVWDGVSNYNSC